jgi:hypothetical protein
MKGTQRQNRAVLNGQYLEMFFKTKPFHPVQKAGPDRRGFLPNALGVH